MKKKIVVVYDLQIDADIWERILQGLGCDVFKFVKATATELIIPLTEAFNNQQYDGVVLDLRFHEDFSRPGSSNLLDGIWLWNRLIADFRSRNIDLFGRTGPVLIASTNDNTDLLIQKEVAKFQRLNSQCTVCWSGVTSDRKNAAKHTFGL